MIEEWRITHKEELRENWKRAQQNKSMKKIKPLE